MSTLSTRKLFLAMLGISVVTVLVALDSTLVGTSLPQVSQELNGLALYPWVGVCYLITNAIAIPIFGRLGDLFGRKPFILISLLVLSIGALLCAFSTSMEMIVLARTVQGVGAGMMIGTSFAAPVDLFPDPKQRVKWLAMISTSFAVASGVGPVLGGFLTETFGWRITFLVVPFFSLYGVWHIWRFLPFMSPTYKTRPRIDWIGMACLVLLIVGLLLAIQLFTVPELSMMWGISSLIVSVLAMFTMYQLRHAHPHPILPLRLFDLSTLRMLMLFATLVGSVMFVLIYYSPLFLQKALSMGPRDTGLMIMPLVAMIPVGSLMNAQFFARMRRPHRLLWVGTIMLALCCLLMFTLNMETTMLNALIIFGVGGLGLGFLLPNLTLLSQQLAHKGDVGVASGLLQTFRSIGSALGVALVGYAMAQTSVSDGMRLGLYGLIGVCFVMLLLIVRIDISYKKD